MEYLFAVLVLGAVVAYAVFVGVSIARGKSWALDFARAVSVMDANSVDYYLRFEARPEPEPSQDEVEETAKLAA